jgi:hypothetical protein
MIAGDDGLCAFKAEIGDSGHSVDAYQTRSIRIRRVSPVAKIRRRNSSLFSLT